MLKLAPSILAANFAGFVFLLGGHITHSIRDTACAELVEAGSPRR